MKSLTIIPLLFILLYACQNSGKIEEKLNNSSNLLHDITAFTSDSLVNVVIEIPAGTNQKWEVNKATGQIEREQLSTDSFRVIDYLSYPANYGFVPQTLLPYATGGDGDPVDVFVLGPSIDRGNIVKIKIVGIIHLLDNDESDSKLLAVSKEEPIFCVNTFEELNKNYPGTIEIITVWLQHYKGNEKVEILSVNDEKDAFEYLTIANNVYIHQKK
jgi:inorganic pyrophosphatase